MLKISSRARKSKLLKYFISCQELMTIISVANSPKIIFIASPDETEGFTMLFDICNNACMMLRARYGQRCLYSAMKPFIYQILKRFMLEPMTVDEWNRLPPPRMPRGEY